MKLNVKAFALSCGLVWGLGVLFLTWWIIAFEGATSQPMMLGHLYRGYNISAMGSFIGLVWGFIDGLLGGAIFAWLYNSLASKMGSAARRETNDQTIESRQRVSQKTAA